MWALMACLNPTALVSGTSPGRFSSKGPFLPGAVAPQLSYFRYVDVPDTLLSPGNYVIAAQYTASGQDDVLDGMFVTPHPAIRFGQARSGAGADLPFPDVGVGAINGFFGPNFQLVVVPEPSPLLLALLAILMFSVTRKWSGRNLRLGRKVLL